MYCLLIAVPVRVCSFLALWRWATLNSALCVFNYARLYILSLEKRFWLHTPIHKPKQFEILRGLFKTVTSIKSDGWVQWPVKLIVWRVLLTAVRNMTAMSGKNNFSLSTYSIYKARISLHNRSLSHPNRSEFPSSPWYVSSQKLTGMAFFNNRTGAFMRCRVAFSRAGLKKLGEVHTAIDLVIE